MWPRLFLFKIFILCALSQALAASLGDGDNDIRRIVNGTEASMESTRHQVSIRLNSYEANSFGSGHICGGILIAPSVVLSAAHCFLDDNNDYNQELRYVVAMGNLDRTVKDKNTLVYDISKFVFNVPKFNVHDFIGDIVVIFLSGSVPAKHPTVRPIALRRARPKDNTICQVTGWGRTKENGKVPTILRTLDVPLLPQQTCEKIKHKEGAVLPGMLCAGYMEGGRDFCYGDSGGPLVCEGELMGIVSWLEDTCAQEGFPSVYTDVVFYRQWVEDVLKANGVQLPDSADDA